MNRQMVKGHEVHHLFFPPRVPLPATSAKETRLQAESPVGLWLERHVLAAQSLFLVLRSQASIDGFEGICNTAELDDLRIFWHNLGHLLEHLLDRRRQHLGQ